ncbi:MAG: cation:proton antiporter [Halobacteria archaeon]
MAAEVLLISSLIILLAVISKVVADHFGVPSVVFLLALGIFFGDGLLGVIDPDLYGTKGLSTIVSLSVAIIVFEGGFHLTFPKIRKSTGSTLVLVTLGSAITFTGVGLSAYYIVGLPWDISFLVSALVIATGPTVITPIMDHVNVRDEVSGLLESEGIIKDVITAIMSIVMFEVVVLGDARAGKIAKEFISILGVGVVIGVVSAVLTYYALKKVSGSPQSSRLISLGSAIMAFAISDGLASESGIAAVAIMGIILGNLDLPNRELISEFKGDITVIVLGVVFLLLAALLDIQDVISQGFRAVLLVLLIMFVIRPLAVFLSTIRSSLTLRERVFVASVGPRGIVPAAVATLFTISLKNEGIAGAENVVNLVFLVILITVVFEAGPAPFLAKKLKIIPMKIIIVGGGRIGRDTADRLEMRNEHIVIIEDDEEVVKELTSDGYNVIEGDGTSADILKKAGIENTKMLVAATGDDDQNILTCQTARTKFGLENVISRVIDQENLDSFNDLGIETVSHSRATSFMIDNMIERPGLFSWMSEFEEGGNVAEVELGSRKISGMGSEQLSEELPENCLLTLVQKGEEKYVPKTDVELELGDRLTIMGRVDDVEKAVKMLE